jgi:Fur family ferric uptake transcriptional regulator
LRRTEQRSVILEELRLSSDHPGADEIYRRVRRRLPRISLGTVYRNLERLASQGLIRKLDYGGGQRHFDGQSRPHGHFRCSRCGRIEDLPFSVPLPELDPGHPWVRERTIQGGRVDYHGLCPGCRAAESGPPGSAKGGAETHETSGA